MKRDWAALHQDIQAELAGYVDGELSAQERERLEAHLAGCAACRADVARQQLLAARLAGLGEEPVPAWLRGSLDTLPAQPAPARWRLPAGPRLSPARLAAAGWGLAAVLALALLLPPADPPGTIPMVDDALADYHQVLARPLPAAEPARLPAPLLAGRPLASWQLTIGGQPASAYAFRRGDQVVVQYQVTEEVFFRQPAVRAAVAREGRYRLRLGDTLVLAVPTPGAGALLVGPAGALGEGQLL